MRCYVDYKNNCSNFIVNSSIYQVVLITLNFIPNFSFYFMLLFILVFVLLCWYTSIKILTVNKHSTSFLKKIFLQQKSLTLN